MILRKVVLVFLIFLLLTTLYRVTKALIIYVLEFDDNTISSLKYAKVNTEAFAKYLQIYDIVDEANTQKDFPENCAKA